jgi:hypothetical protein
MKVRVSPDKSNPRAMTQGMSTSLKLRQDKMGLIKMIDGQPEGWIIGVNNDRFFNYISDMYLKMLKNNTKPSEYSQERTEFLEKTVEDKTKILNSFLDANPIYAFGV